MALDAVRISRARPDQVVAPAGHAGGSGMSAETFDVMHRVEREHWWFAAKRALVVQALQGDGPRGLAVDVGCGTGAEEDHHGDDAGRNGPRPDAGQALVIVAGERLSKAQGAGHLR